MEVNKIKNNKELIDAVYDLNKVVWHDRNMRRGCELHHVYGRVGIVKCCARMFEPGVPGHQDNWKWVEGLREARREDLKQLEGNYMRGIGCRAWIWPECSWCAMPKYDEAR